MDNKLNENIISNRPIKIPIKIYSVIILFGLILISFMITASSLALLIIKAKETVHTELFHVKENLLKAEHAFDNQFHFFQFDDNTETEGKDFSKYYEDAAEILQQLAGNKDAWSSPLLFTDELPIINNINKFKALIYELNEESKIVTSNKSSDVLDKTEFMQIATLRKVVNEKWDELFNQATNYFYNESQKFDAFRRLIVTLFVILFFGLVLSIYIYNKHRKDDYLLLSTQYEKLGDAYREIEETKEELRYEEERYKLLVMNAPVGIHELNRNGKFISLNKYGIQLFSDSFSDLQNSEFSTIVAPSDRERIWELFYEALEGKEKYFEFMGISQNEEHRYFSSCFIPEKDEDGYVNKVIGITQEITAERNAIFKAERLQRLYDILSEINHVIVRENNPNALYDKVCKIFIEKGNFKLVWIGNIINGQVKVASYDGIGSQYLNTLEINYLQKEHSHDNISKSINLKKTIVVNDIVKNGSEERWLSYCKENGIASSASVPIILENEVVAVLSVISDKKNYFEEPETVLIEKIGDDISFAISKYQIENNRKREEKAVEQIEAAVSTTIGKDFFDTINKEFINILGAEISFVGKIDDKNKMINIISGYDYERRIEGNTFDLENSFCKNIIEQVKPSEFCYIEDGPIGFLKNKNINSYFGVPLFNSDKKVIGLFVLLFSEQVKDIKLLQTLLRLYSPKIGIELEREDMLNRLLESDNRFNSLLTSSPRGISIYDKSGALLVSNSKWEKLWGFERKNSVGSYNILTDEKTKRLGLLEDFKKVLNGEKVESAEFEITDESSMPSKKKYILPNIFTTLNNNNEVEYLVFLLEDITPKKTAEMEREKAEEKYIQLFESSNDAIYLIYENRFEMVNKKFTEMFGYTNEEVCNEDFNLDVLLTESSLELVRERRAKIRKGEYVPPIYEFTAVTKEGKTIKCEASVTYFDYKDGIGLQGIIRDISERDKLIKSLKDSIKSYEGLFENTIDAIYIQKPDGRFITVNKGAEKMYGYKKEEFIGRTPDFLSAEGMNNLEELGKIIEKAFSGKPQRFPFWGKRKNGEIFPKEVRMHAGKYFDEDVLIVFAQDITERIERESKLKASEARYRTLFQSSSDAIILLKERTFVDCNDRTLEMFNCRRDQIIGAGPDDFSPPMQADGKISSEALTEKLDLCLSGKPQIFEWKLTALDGSEFDSEISVTKLDLPEGAYILFIIRDITKRKTAEREIRLAREKAEQASRIKSAFLSQISHEIRTPLAHFSQYFGLLQGKLSGVDLGELDFIFDTLKTSENRITRTIESIVIAAELSTNSYEFKPKTLAFEKDLIEPLIREFTPEARNRNIELKKSGNAPDGKIFFDEQAMKWILKNLVENAIKYTPKGKVEIIYKFKKDKAVIKVIDTGIGIKKEYLDKLFDEPFSQVDLGYTRKFDGNGLGLWMTKALCDLGSATIDVETEVGKGTTFIVEIPLTS